MKNYIAVLAISSFLLSGCASGALESDELPQETASTQPAPSEKVIEEAEAPAIKSAVAVRLDEILAVPNCGYYDDSDVPPTFEQNLCMQYYPLPTDVPVDDSLYYQLPDPLTPVGLQEHLLQLFAYTENLEVIQQNMDVRSGAGGFPFESINLIEQRFLNLWQPLGLTSLSERRIWVDHNGYDEWHEWASGLTQDKDYLSLWNKETGLFGLHCWVKSDSYCTASDFLENGKLATSVIGPDYDGHSVYETAAHEAIHTLQGELTFNGKCWWTEGTAMMFSSIVGFSGRTEQVNLFLQNTNIESMSVAEIQVLFENDTVCDVADYGRYYAGFFAVEHMLLSWPLATFYDFWSTASEVGWEPAVTSILGTSPEDLDASIAQHVYDTVNKKIPDADYGKPWEKSWAVNGN